MIKGTHAQSFILPAHIRKTQPKTQLGSDSNSTQRFSVLFVFNGLTTAWKAEMPNNFCSVFFNWNVYKNKAPIFKSIECQECYEGC